METVVTVVALVAAEGASEEASDSASVARTPASSAVGMEVAAPMTRLSVVRAAGTMIQIP